MQTVFAMSDKEGTVEEEAGEENPVSEENEAEETVEETSEEPEKKENCIVIPESMKPLFECCKEFDEGKINDSTFFAKALVRTGEFMQNVKKRNVDQQETSEE